MQTVHSSRASTQNCGGAVVDIREYRRKLGAVDGSLALAPPFGAAPPRPRPVRTSRSERRRRTLADWLDAAATLILIAVAVTVWLQLMA